MQVMPKNIWETENGVRGLARESFNGEVVIEERSLEEIAAETERRRDAFYDWMVERLTRGDWRYGARADGEPEEAR